MCWQDIKIARATKRTGEMVTVFTAGSKLFIPFNPKRYALIIGCSILDTFWISWINPVTAGTGVPILSGQGNLVLNLRDHGDLVKGPIYAISNASDCTVPYYESILNEETITEIDAIPLRGF